jgi:hypothetical protein
MQEKPEWCFPLKSDDSIFFNFLLQFGFMSDAMRWWWSARGEKIGENY